MQFTDKGISDRRMNTRFYKTQAPLILQTEAKLYLGTVLQESLCYGSSYAHCCPGHDCDLAI